MGFPEDYFSTSIPYIYIHNDSSGESIRGPGVITPYTCILENVNFVIKSEKMIALNPCLQ